jgi:hypothetical protein
MPTSPDTPRPPSSRWTSFLADPDDDRPRILSEEGNPALWTVLAVDRATRRWVVAQARRQLEAAEDAYARLYAGG